MADSSFFKRASDFTTAEIAEATGATLRGAAHEYKVLKDISPLDQAGDDHLSFFDNIKYKHQFIQTKAGACFVKSEFVEIAPKGLTLLVTSEPYKAYALAAQKFYPEPYPEPYISKQAILDPSCKIGEGCHIEAGAVIKKGAKIGVGSWIASGAVIGENVQIGKQCRIESNAVVSHAHIGNHVRIYPGALIGQDGFGFAIDPKGFVKVPQLGRVMIEDFVQIGAGTCIDRGSGPDTVIGMGTWIDNLVQIAHNVKIGRGCILVGQVGIAGSTIVDDYVVMAGQVGVAGHLHIGKGAKLAARTGVIQDVPAGAELMGYPAQPLKDFMRQTVALKRLIKKKKTV